MLISIFGFSSKRYSMNATNPPKVIAEIGCNHMGNMEIAKEMIRVAAEFCDVDVIKFQKRSPKDLLSNEEYNRPHPNPHHSYGKTYGEHREFLELNLEQHLELKELTESFGKTYSTSVWDLRSAGEIISLNPTFIKIPSATNLDFKILDLLIHEYTAEIHLSTGMTTLTETDQIISHFEKHQRADDLVLYACTSGYPVPFEDVALLEIRRLTDLYAKRVKSIGFSGHHLGIAVDIAAITLGAQWVERHFTLDRTWKGTDHAASLEPDGMRKLVRDIRNVSLALQYKSSEILPIEKEQRKKLKRNVHD